jgi:putative oxidoreductase
MNTLSNLSILIGRIGLSAIFILSGIAKLGPGYAATQGYMESMGVSGALLPLVIFAEIAGGLAVLSGFLTRWAAIGLAVFSIASAFLFHYQFADQMQFVSFFKNVAMAGGFLVLAAQGAGAFSIDGWLASRRAKAGTR